MGRLEEPPGIVSGVFDSDGLAPGGREVSALLLARNEVDL